MNAEWVNVNGEWKAWKDATVHVFSHALHYGTAAFEGVRVYDTPQGPALFRLEDHCRRLVDSWKTLGGATRLDWREWAQLHAETVRRNWPDIDYVRAILFYGVNSIGVNPSDNPEHFAVGGIRFGKYLGGDGFEKGIRVMVSSYQRSHPNVCMLKGKISGNYANSVLAKVEAIRHGFEEAIQLDTQGFVSEGSSENVFIVRKGVLHSPPCNTSLEGITRDSVIQLARQEGLPFAEKTLSRDELYGADEVFLTGTAAEVTPVREIDGRVVGEGKPGPITLRLRKKFFEAIQGKLPEFRHWLWPVELEPPIKAAEGKARSSQSIS